MAACRPARARAACGPAPCNAEAPRPFRKTGGALPLFLPFPLECFPHDDLVHGEALGVAGSGRGLRVPQHQEFYEANAPTQQVPSPRLAAAFSMFVMAMAASMSPKSHVSGPWSGVGWEDAS